MYQADIRVSEYEYRVILPKTSISCQMFNDLNLKLRIMQLFRGKIYDDSMLKLLILEKFCKNLGKLLKLGKIAALFFVV